MERKRDHRLDGAEVDVHTAVVVSDFRRIQLFVLVSPAVLLKERLRLFIGAPDGGKTCGLGGHDVHAVPVVGAHGSHARSHELHDLVLHIAVLVDRAADRDGDILRSDPGSGLSGEVDRHDLRVSVVPGVAQDLLVQLAAALADSHGAQGAVAGVGVRAEDHLPAARGHLPHVLVDDGHVRGNEDPAVLLRGSESEHVVILIDGAAHRVQGIVAAGQGVGDREGGHARSSRRLDDADVGNVVGGQLVELDLQMIHVIALVVGLQDSVGDGALLRFFLISGLSGKLLDLCCFLFRNDLASVYEVDAAVIKIDHTPAPFRISIHIISVCLC